VPDHHRGPANNFIPDYGRITAYRGATGMGIRLDGGTAYSGAVITRYYDSACWRRSPPGRQTPRRHRADGPGVARVPHPRRVDQHRLRREPAEAPDLPELQLHHTKFIDETPELFDFKPRRDRAPAS
jgi:pyruvate carboxylase